ncbi:hypothetical protein BS50DRAFT_589694 [Corynespora cassiicola Philippines]|uniref:histone deacetylase n=1 Tax=Corynespora cassiicola Philippines TaxID=1448308 RepID=A0A2T2NIL4_CORCC|nr:hypothetical protein BS50DRAFT_589694 [Corynespora cassiicola Philippines]
MANDSTSWDEDVASSSSSDFAETDNSNGDEDIDDEEAKVPPRAKGKAKPKTAEPKNQVAPKSSRAPAHLNKRNDQTLPKAQKVSRELKGLEVWPFFDPHKSTRLSSRAVDYGKKSSRDVSSRLGPSSKPSTSINPAAPKRPPGNPVIQALWDARRIEEGQPHSKNNPFIPTKSDIQRWIYDSAPDPLPNPRKFTQVPGRVRPGPDSARMGYFPNGKHNIVQEYLAPDSEFIDDYSTFKHLTDDQKRSVIAREAEENGMEKPQGYTVSFHYNPNVEYHHFGSSHPMKPWRLTLTKQLVVAYGLEYTMDLFVPRPAQFEELKQFHNEEYLSFLSQVTPQNAKPDDPAYLAFGFGGESNDCPVFDGLWNYVSLYSYASMHAAQNLLSKQSDIAINWSGGLHHAKKNVASGFCYVNDIVLAIQLLLSQHQRVLYIDIDVHHGDGVEAAFESSDRVFTLSYHKFGTDRNGYPFFPGTGNIDDIGPKDPRNPGKGHSLNIPIDDGIDDDQYKWLFKTITGAVIDKYNPGAIVLQSGADSLGGDRLGRFNLNIKAHGFCVETVKGYNRPLLLIGGGGYTPRNVARTWCHETAVCVGAELHNELPTHLPYIQAFQGEENGGGILYPDLHNTKRHDNLNNRDRLQKIVEQAMENLRYLEGAPSVVINTQGIPLDAIMRIRAEVDAQLEDEARDRDHLSVEQTRRKKERNTGGRHERGMR